MWTRKKVHFSAKKGACGHADTQKSVFFIKKGACGHAEPQQKIFPFRNMDSDLKLNSVSEINCEFD